MRDAANLNARAIVFKALLQSPLHRAVVALLIHVDEVDDDQPGKISQAQLSRDFVGCLQICLQRSVLDMVLARGPAGIDVDRNQRLGLVEHDVTASCMTGENIASSWFSTPYRDSSGWVSA